MSYITTYNGPAIQRGFNFNSVLDQFDALFPRVFTRDHWTDAVGLKFDDKSQTYSTEIDVAGYKKADISVEVEDGYVTVMAKNEKRGSASRSFYLSDADPETVSASLEDGVLSVSVKKFPAKQPRRIEIK